MQLGRPQWHKTLNLLPLAFLLPAALPEEAGGVLQPGIYSGFGGFWPNKSCRILRSRSEVIWVWWRTLQVLSLCWRWWCCSEGGVRPSFRGDWPDKDNAELLWDGLSDIFSENFWEAIIIHHYYSSRVIICVRLYCYFTHVISTQPAEVVPCGLLATRIGTIIDRQTVFPLFVYQLYYILLLAFWSAMKSLQSADQWPLSALKVTVFLQFWPLSCFLSSWV